jgi:cobalamin biosynthetic protein CobC
MARFGGARTDWLDLSTGINPDPYPVPEISQDAWAALPRKTEMARLTTAAQTGYGTQARVIAMNGAQGAIQAMPWMRKTGHAAVLAPTYNEHAASLRAAGWTVDEVSSLAEAEGADLTVVVNPNNPDGQSYAPERLATFASKVGCLVIDESFVDTDPALSLSPSLHLVPKNIVILRSFGKFYGLAGLRLGFALAQGDLAERLAAQAGPWPVSGPAIEIACAALTDRSWQAEAIARLTAGADRLDQLATEAGWSPVGGTALFRTYAAPDAEAAQTALAQSKVWTRIFPYSKTWIRLGLPPKDRWDQLIAAMRP